MRARGREGKLSRAVRRIRTLSRWQEGCPCDVLWRFLRRSRWRWQVLRLTDVEHFAALAVLNVEDGVVAHLRGCSKPLVPSRDHAPILIHRHFKVGLDSVLWVDCARRIANFATVRTQLQAANARFKQQRVVLDVVVIVVGLAVKIIVCNTVRVRRLA